MQPMEYVYFDMPQIFKDTQSGMDFMFALEHYDDIEIFSHPSIQILVRSHWNIWKPWNFWMLGFPLGI